MEAGTHEPRRATLDVIRRALVEAGVELIDENGGGPGVRLRKAAKGKSRKWVIEPLRHLKSSRGLQSLLEPMNLENENELIDGWLERRPEAIDEIEKVLEKNNLTWMQYTLIH